MALSNDLISQFVKSTKDTTPDKKEATVYGTTVMLGGKTYVKIDGSELLTPVIVTSEVKAAERVTVMVKDHYAIVTGNLTTPAASTDTTDGLRYDTDRLSVKVGEFELIIADKISVEQLEASLAIINEALIGKATIEQLNAAVAFIEEAYIEDLYVNVADIQEAMIGKAEITDLEAIYANIEIMDVDIANIKTLVGGNLTMDNIQSLILTSSKVTVDNAFIKNAMIDTVNANKINAGTVNTDLVNIGSQDGSMTLAGSLQQFRDEHGNVRIQIGKDSSGDFTFILYGEDGIGQLINQNGIQESSIADGLLVDRMVAGDANISGTKINISSVINEINDNSTKILSSSIYMNDEEQTLDITFGQLTTKTDSLEGELESTKTDLNSLLTDFSVAQGEISALISNTTMVDIDGNPISLKDDYTNFKITVDGISSKVGSLETVYAKTLKTTKTEYYLSLSAISLIGGSWSEATPEWVVGKYLWQRTTYIYSDNSTSVGATVCIQGAKGEDGEQGVQGPQGNQGIQGPQGNIGVGIKTIVEYYQVSSSNTTQPTTWVTTPPNMTTTNKYLWNYEVVTYTDNSTKSTDKRVIGVYGNTGNTGSQGISITGVVNRYLASASATGVTTSTSGWTTTIQNVTNTLKYLWNYETINYSSGNPTVTSPCIIGVYGDKGLTGDTGAVGQSVTNVTPQFAKHTSPTTSTGISSWSDTCPAYEKGKYLWIRSKVTYANPTETKYTTPYYDASWDAKGAADDASQTVTSKVSEFQQTIDSISSEVSEQNQTIGALQTTTTNMGTSITQINAELSLKASTSYVNSQINTVTGTIDTKINDAKADIKITTDGIDSRVSNVESNQTELEGDLTSIENRVSTAEEKITPSAIINTVSSSYYNKEQTDTQITSKGYLNQTQVSQIVNELQIRIEESGGNNLLRNSAFKDGTAGWTYNRWDTTAGGNHAFHVRYSWSNDEWTIQNRNTLCVSVGGLNTSNSSRWIRAGMDSDRFSALPNYNYTIRVLMATHRVNNVTIEMLCYDSNGNRISDSNHSTTRTCLSGGRDRTNWTDVIHHFTTSPGTVTCMARIFMNQWDGTSDSAVLWIGEPIVLRGHHSNPPYTMNADEMYAGIVKMNYNGVNVSMENGEGNQGSALVAYDGFSIYDQNGRRKAWFGEKETAYISSLTADNIYSPRLIKNNKGRPTNYYIAPSSTGDGSGRDTNNKSNSINHTLNWIRENYGQYCEADDMYFHIDWGVYNEDIFVSGWLGSGIILFYFDNHATWYGCHAFEENTMGVRFSGRRWNEGQWINEGCTFIKRSWHDALFRVRKSQVEFCYLRAIKEGWSGGSGVWNGYTNVFANGTYGAQILVAQCDVVGFYHLVTGHQNTLLALSDNRGHVYNMMYMSSGSICVTQGYIPLRAYNALDNWCAHWIDKGCADHNSWIQPKDTYVPPPEPTWAWFENTFELYNLRTVTEGSGSSTSNRSGEWGQGKWGSYQAHRGYADLGDNPASWCSGGRNFTIWMTIRRTNSSHGYSGDVPRPRIRLSDGSFWDCGVGLARGQTVTFELHGDIAWQIYSGNAKTLQMWAGTSTNDYSFYDYTAIRIRCEKQI